MGRQAMKKRAAQARVALAHHRNPLLWRDDFLKATEELENVKLLFDQVRGERDELKRNYDSSNAQIVDLSIELSNYQDLMKQQIGIQNDLKRANEELRLEKLKNAELELLRSELAECKERLQYQMLVAQEKERIIENSKLTVKQLRLRSKYYREHLYSAKKKVKTLEKNQYDCTCGIPCSLNYDEIKNHQSKKARLIAGKKELCKIAGSLQSGKYVHDLFRFLSKTQSDEASNATGEASKASKKALKAHGETSKASAEASKLNEEASKASAEAPNLTEEASKAPDEESKLTEEASRTPDQRSVDEAFKALVESLQEVPNYAPKVLEIRANF